MAASAIVNQIETSAGDFGPQVYQLLTQFSDFEQSPDGMAQEFIPLTQVRVNDPQKLMVIGVLPPSAVVTGKLLDRSYSSVETATADAGGRRGTTGNSLYPSDELVPADPNSPRYSYAKSLPPEFWDAFVGMAKRCNTNPEELAAILCIESQFNPGAYNPGGPAKGIAQLTPGANLKRLGFEGGANGETWQNFCNLSATEQLAYVEPYLKACGFRPSTQRSRIYASWLGGMAGNPSVDGGAQYVNTADPAALDQALRVAQYEVQSLEAKASNKPLTPGEKQRLAAMQQVVSTGKLPKHDYQATAYAQNKGLDRDKDGIISVGDLGTVSAGLPPPFIKEAIEAAKARGGSGPIPTQEALRKLQQETKTQWADSGADASDESKKQEESFVSTGYNSSGLGQRYQNAQRVQIQELQRAIEDMQNTPPLRMLVNPTEWSVAHEKVMSDGDRSRSGPIVQVWGAGQPKISASGKVPGFFSIDALAADGPGLTRHARNYSKGWQHFQSLCAIYRNNGRIYLTDRLAGGEAKNLTMVGSVYIYYDNTLYIGSFDSLNVSEADTAPFTAEYDFEFSVRAMFLLDRPIDLSLPAGDRSYLSGGALPGSRVR